MATKLNFRARTLDASKPMLVYHSEDLPDLADLNAINRSVPAMPSGMEKEEEAEKHLQDILESQEKKAAAAAATVSQMVLEASTAAMEPTELYIPTPEVFVATDADGMYETMYKSNFRTPRAYIHVQPFSADHDQPDYDMDEEDEKFLNDVLREQKKFEVNEITFEDMLDRLEKNSGHNVVSAKEAKLLLKEDDELILAVYDYWVDKRLRLKQPLIPTVKSDKRDGATTTSTTSASTTGSSNPYVAFRRRTEKMQTRKNRKNDEASYEKMLKLRRDLSRAVTLLEMVKRREKTKKENLNLTKDIFEKRYASSDFDGRIITEVLAQRAQQQQHRVLQPSIYHRYRYAENWVNHMSAQQQGSSGDQAGRQKRPYTKKKRHKSSQRGQLHQLAGYGGIGRGVPLGNGPEFGTSLGVLSSDEEAGQEGIGTSIASPSDLEEELEEGPFAFRRKRHCQYLAPLIDENGFEQFHGWPWEGPLEDEEEAKSAGEAKYRYSLASLSTPKPRCVGMVRRRVGRGGRITLDRAFSTDHDDFWRSLDFTVVNGVGRGGGTDGNDPKEEEEEVETPNLDLLNEDWPHYRPVTPPHCREEPDFDPYAPAGLNSCPSGTLLPPGGLAGLLPVRLPSSSSSSSTPSRVTASMPTTLTTTALLAGPGRLSNGGAMRTVSVDSLVAHNAASAVVNSNTIDLFQPQQQQQSVQ